ncbi:histone-lysine N-methyltransferase SETMAR-like [Vespula squamosa]|uniref:Histone-lysine N-methyltransferase SETMAR-like n=1 Tax=Vespula squamosa TaxID=30214 RepID=A0ABD2BSA1_VESSQ
MHRNQIQPNLSIIVEASTAAKLWASLPHKGFIHYSKILQGTLIYEEKEYAVSDTHDVAKKPNIDHKTIVNHLKKIGYKKRANVYEAHDYIMKNLIY